MAKNNKTRFFYVLYSDKTRVFDQSKRAYYPIYVIKPHKVDLQDVHAYIQIYFIMQVMWTCQLHYLTLKAQLLIVTVNDDNYVMH